MREQFFRKTFFRRVSRSTRSRSVTSNGLIGDTVSSTLIVGSVEEINTIIHHELSCTYIFEYSDNVKPYDLNTALEHSDIWDHMPGIVIPLSNH